jgi:MFS family permease
MTTRPGDPPVAAVDRAAIAGALLPVAAGVLPAFLVGALAVQIRGDIGFDESGLGLLTGVFFAGGAASSTTLGRMVERHGAIRAMRIGATASAVVLVLIAAIGRSYGALLVLLALAGAANALIQPAANLYLARAIPPRRQGLAFGIKQSAIPAGALLGGLAVPAIGLTLGWRWAFVGAAVLATTSVIVLPDRQPRATPPTRVDPSLPTTDAPRWITLCFAGGAVFAAGTAGVLGAFLVSGAVEVGLAESRAGLLAAGASAVSIAMRLLLGARADRRGGRHLRVVAWMLASGSIAFALLASGTTAVFVLAAPLAYALSWSWPGLFNLSMVRHHPQAPGAATGITQTGVYVGAVAGPLVFGLVAEGGYGAAWLMAGAWSVMAGALIGGARVLLVRHREAGSHPLPA